MEIYPGFGVSYLILTFVNKINTKLKNDSRVYLIDDFYYKVDQNRTTLAILTLSLFLSLSVSLSFSLSVCLSLFSLSLSLSLSLS